jgi:alpha-mannosidase
VDLGAADRRAARLDRSVDLVERPTHFNTRADAAQFEVPGHRFADVSEHGFGVALLSAATYGWSTLGGEMRMTLLRSPRWPDPDADRGAHELAFAVFPHTGGWQEAGVTSEALRFNAPLLVGDGEADAAGSRSWFACDELMVDTVKPAEDGDGVIVRLYEPHGARGTARLRVGVPFGTAWFTNLLEDRIGPAEVDGDEIVIPFRPFEIVTVALSRPPLGTKVPGLAPS